MDNAVTIGNAVDFVQRNFGTFGFGNLLPHLKSFSRNEINSVVVLENNDPLIKIHETERIYFVGGWPVEESPYLRQTAWTALQNASEYLPPGLGFGLLECFRSFLRQQFLRDDRYKFFKNLHRDKSEAEIWALVDTFIARPGGPHQTGGAIDLTLIDLKTMKPLDMGSPKHGTNQMSYTASNLVSLEAQVHRYILCTILTHFGFRNYPAEWWHYEYGTKRHAKYLLFDTCPYGVISEN